MKRHVNKLSITYCITPKSRFVCLKILIKLCFKKET